MCAKPNRCPADRAGAQRKGHAAEGPRGQMGDCVLLSDGTKGCAFMSLCCGCAWWASQGTEKWGETKLGSIMKTMHLTPLAGDTAEISLLALKLTESCPLPSVLSPFPSDRVLHVGTGPSMECRNSGTARFQGTKLSLVTGT